MSLAWIQTTSLPLMDEALTPDSSRFWPLSDYFPGQSPKSFDKQIIRDYLETLDWNKSPSCPKIPKEIMTKAANKYQRNSYNFMQLAGQIKMMKTSLVEGEANYSLSIGKKSLT